jgi:hypothetical protein
LSESVPILTLPPDSPELNPTEQLWDLIRERRFVNKTYGSLDEVEDDLAEELRAVEAAVLPGSLAPLGSSSSPKSTETFPCTSITLRDFRNSASARSARRSRVAICASRLLPPAQARCSSRPRPAA